MYVIFYIFLRVNLFQIFYRIIKVRHFYLPLSLYVILPSAKFKVRVDTFLLYMHINIL
jgi:hypothetical protein